MAQDQPIVVNGLPVTRKEIEAVLYSRNLPVTEAAIDHLIANDLNQHLINGFTQYTNEAIQSAVFNIHRATPIPGAEPTED